MQIQTDRLFKKKFRQCDNTHYNIRGFVVTEVEFKGIQKPESSLQTIIHVVTKSNVLMHTIVAKAM